MAKEKPVYDPAEEITETARPPKLVRDIREFMALDFGTVEALISQVHAHLEPFEREQLMVRLVTISHRLR